MGATTLSKMAFSITILRQNAGHYAECSILFIVMLNVIKLIVVASSSVGLKL